MVRLPIISFPRKLTEISLHLSTTMISIAHLYIATTLAYNSMGLLFASLLLVFVTTSLLFGRFLPSILSCGRCMFSSLGLLYPSLLPSDNIRIHWIGPAPIIWNSLSLSLSFPVYLPSRSLLSPLICNPSRSPHTRSPCRLQECEWNESVIISNITASC